MRIAVDLQACQNTSRGRGIARYAMALTRAMCRAGRGHEFRVLLNAGFPDTIAHIRRDLEGCIAQEDIHVMAFDASTASAYPANAWRTRAAELLRVEMVDALAPDLVFVPSLFEGYHDATVVSVEPERHVTAVTVFDFIPAEYSEVYLPAAGTRAAYARRLSQAAHADVLLPISEYVGEQARARLGVPAEHIVPAPLGVEAHFRPVELAPAARAAMLARYGIGRPFVLNASPFEFRKNLEGLIAGYGVLPRELRDAHQLVIVGRMAPAERDRLQWLAREAGLAPGGLVLAGYVPDDDLVALYAACELFVFPSLSEGFGLPVLEAMACGAAVIGSDTTSIPEVIGRADMLFPPRDPRAMAARMARVLTDAAVRDELRRAGVARAAPFTWERTAERTLDAFEAAVARRSPSRPGRAREGGGRRERATVALVLADATEGGASTDAELEALIVALAMDVDVTLVSDGVRTLAELPLAGTLDPAAFADTAAGFDRVAYLLDASVADAQALDLLSRFPGPVVLRSRAPSPHTACSAREAFAAGGWPAWLSATGGAAPLGPELSLRRVRKEATVVLQVPTGRDDWSALAAQLLAAPAGPHERLRAFADALPARVRNRAADAEDLARLSQAWVRAEAVHRTPRVWLDVTGLAARERLDPADEPLLRALLEAGGSDLRCLAADRGRRYRSGDAHVAELLRPGEAPALLETPVAPRPGDWLIACEAWGGLDAAAARPFMEAGAGCVRIAHGERDRAPVARDLFARLWELQVGVRGGELDLTTGGRPCVNANSEEAVWIARV